MPYIPTFDRTKMMMCSWDAFVEPKMDEQEELEEVSEKLTGK